jgi:hypothetical protein
VAKAVVYMVTGDADGIPAERILPDRIPNRQLDGIPVRAKCQGIAERMPAANRVPVSGTGRGIRYG